MTTMSQRDYLELLGAAGELGAFAAGSVDIDGCLHHIVEMVARHLEADVCSLYIYEEASGELVLRATHGLRPESVGKIRMKEGEGLVGAALARKVPVVENKASSNPNFRYFPDSGEDRFESFVAIPVMRGSEKVGVLTAQRVEEHHFARDDVRALGIVASQLAGTIENARALLEITEISVPEVAMPKTMLVLKGEPASPGYASGGAQALRRGGQSLEQLGERVPPELTLRDFNAAVEGTVTQIEELQKHLADAVPEAATLVFGAHILMLKDDGFTGTMRKKIEAGQRVGEAVLEVAGHYVQRFGASAHAYMREKTKDIEDISRRLLANLIACELPGQGESAHDRIVMTTGQYPSDIVLMWVEGVNGIVITGEGGATSHVAIVARSLQIPMVVIGEHAIPPLEPGTPMMLDGGSGIIYINPTPETMERLHAAARSFEAAKQAERSMGAVTTTRDGTRIHLMANINLLSELALANKLSLEGVGLYRTEFPFLVRYSLPTEEEQIAVYRKLITAMEAKPVTFRTLDVGGEKLLSYFDHGSERNPDLGLRSTRFLLRHPDLLTTQLRAILRAARGHKEVRIMFPMVASLDEFRTARNAVFDCLIQLDEEGYSPLPSPLVGMMIELPSVVPLIDTFAREVAFFSIGTNDFVQYMLAVDRSNDQLAHEYCPHHPAVLRTLKTIVQSANSNGTELSICGEMAHHLHYVPFLIGIGVRRFSIDPHRAPALQNAIAKWTCEEAEHYAAVLLENDSQRAIGKLLRETPEQW
jgi:phosphotransferase system, enzyme I, PtsP